MNLLAVAAIGAFVLVEKVLRHGPLVGRLAGVLLVAWGAYLLALSA
jgi:predicted metal-binding membrane protein